MAVEKKINKIENENSKLKIKINELININLKDKINKIQEIKYDKINKIEEIEYDKINKIQEIEYDKINKYQEKTKIICDKCNFNCNSIDIFKNHLNNECRPSINSNNIYSFNSNTLGYNKYKEDNGGDIYIIQTEFNLKGYYKIGISTDLYKRLGQYRCGAVLEPKLHCYYPCKNIKVADKLLKHQLKKFNIKREIYKTDNLQEIKYIIKNIQIQMNSENIEIIPEVKDFEIIACKFCDVHFTNKIDLNEHIINNHIDELNCEKNLYIQVDDFNLIKYLLKNNYSLYFNSNEIKNDEITKKYYINGTIDESIIPKNYETKEELELMLKRKKEIMEEKFIVPPKTKK
ncbi:MAG: GIY-YIG nuclease family protein [Candidatus Fonsibacter sp.]|nr:GIY-YIG nuclease family protein [Candidatus Fonsibacter sp.]